jgi:hypothetical protein
MEIILFFVCQAGILWEGRLFQNVRLDLHLVSSICSAVMCKNNFQLTYNKRKVLLIFCEILLHVMMGL